MLAAAVASSPGLGLAEGRCRPGEPGPAIMIEARGLKDRRGVLRAELYPPDDADFLADDNVLVSQGKTFRRSEIALPAAGPVRICIRVPAPGRYTLALLHDRDANHRFSVLTDGIGFPGNPAIRRARPQASEATIVAGPGITTTDIILNYHRGLFAFGPLERRPR
jgi:uncharacterized protein (DUF2141 family)